MEYNEVIKFYETNLEILQILKSLEKRSTDFYKKFSVDSLKAELASCFFEMNKAEICNNLPEYFFHLQKQIEIIIDYSIKNIITIDKIKEDSKTIFIDSDEGKTPLGKFLFAYNYPPEKNENKIYSYIKNRDRWEFKIQPQNEALINGFVAINFEEWSKAMISQFEGDLEKIEFNKIPVSQKLNIFYAYYISKNPNEKKDNVFTRNKILSIYTTNTMIAFRNQHSHGNVDLKQNQSDLINAAKVKNLDNLYFFYNEYYKILYAIVSNFIKKSSNAELLM